MSKDLEMKIQEAKELLIKNGYAIKKWTDAMDEDADRCSNGEEILCSDCTCHFCMAGNDY